MIKQNAVDLARTARSEVASIKQGTKSTIAQIVTNWNECVKQAGFMGVFDFPTTGYTRKAQIVADLLRCAEQLDDYVEPRPELATMTVEQQTREINAALTRVFDADEAHSEALEMNTETDRRRKISVMTTIQNEIMEKPYLPAQVEACHAEALEIAAQLEEYERRRAQSVAAPVKVDVKAICERMAARRIEDAHAEALETNKFIEYATKNRAFRAYWLKSYSGNSIADMNAWDAMHTEALEMNEELDVRKNARDFRAWQSEQANAGNSPTSVN